LVFLPSGLVFVAVGLVFVVTGLVFVVVVDGGSETVDAVAGGFLALKVRRAYV
jgi:drug/metabolite transporter superfamily protein YnfA